MLQENEYAVEYLVSDTDELIRIDKFISVIFPQYSRTLVQKMIKQSSLLVNGLATKANYIVRLGVFF